MPTVTNHSDMELEVPAIGAVLAPGDSVEVSEADAPFFHGHGVLTLTGWDPPESVDPHGAAEPEGDEQ